MENDKFVKEIKDKMNHGVSRLSPIARSLYFSLTWEFLSQDRKKNTIKTRLLSFAKHLGIAATDPKDILVIIENSFREIHTNTFVKYKFEFSHLSHSDQIDLTVSKIDNNCQWCKWPLMDYGPAIYLWQPKPYTVLVNILEITNHGPHISPSRY